MSIVHGCAPYSCTTISQTHVPLAPSFSPASKGTDGGAEEEQTRTGGGEAGAGAVEEDEVNAKGEEGPSPPSMTPDQVEEFFQNTIARLTSPEEREVIKSKV